MAEKMIEIPQIVLQQVLVRIVGQTPLLTNRFSERSKEAIEDNQQKKAKLAREARDPEIEFREAMHLISPGVYGFPASGVRKALVAAGGRFADEKMTHLRGVINLAMTHVPIIGPEPTMRSDPARIRSGVFTIAYRPQFWPWRMDVPITFNGTIISQAQIVNLFQIAGFSVGIGSWRPESGGTFGQFTVEDEAIAQAA